MARALILKAMTEPIRVLCAREFQNSIAQSVHKLLASQIDALDFGSKFIVQQRSIECISTGSEFIFEGLRFNITKIKSMEGIDFCWVEEAQTVSETSWEILIPTIRRPGSEIWITFNPDLPEDATYRRFAVDPPPGAAVVKINWYDNPWLPGELLAEKNALWQRDLAAYRNVWLGECRDQVANPLWTKEMLEASREMAWTTEDDRQELLTSMRRIVVAVDPSGCHGPDDKRSDEIGIVVAGIGHDNIARILEDRSGRYSPQGWARECVAAYQSWRADRIVAEKNFGGALVAATIRTANAAVPVREVDASRGKIARAEPVAALYEQGRVRHIGYFAELERQMLLFSTTGYKGSNSPDRADAMVWALTELVVDSGTDGLLEFYREEQENLSKLSEK